MNNIWLATDWHLWNTEYDDGMHEFKSITRLGQLADNYAQMIDSSDIFIHLGDLCDPSNTRPEKLKSIITSIPGTKVLCRGNHDIETDAYYLNAGFDYVCEILKINDFVFSHKPVKITPDQINVHGHLHTRKISTMDHRYVNAYDVNYTDRPVLLEDLLQGAIHQKSSDYAGTEFKQDKVDKMFKSIENDHYENILDLSSEFSLDEQLIQENETYKQMLRDNSISTGINVHDLLETSIAPALHSLSATEIEKEDDPLDEIIFEEPEDTIKWEQDDDNPKLYKEKEPMAEATTTVSAIYYGLTEAEAKKRYLSYSSNKYNLKGVNTTLDGLKRVIRDNDMQNLITHYTVLDPSVFDIDDSVDYDYEYDMIAVKIPFKFRIDKVYELDVSNLNEAATFKQVKKIVDNIPQEEHHYFYHGNQFKDSPYVKYRNARYITKNGKKYGAFIDVYSFDSEPEIGIIVLASEPEARGHGLTDKLIKDAKDNMTKCGYTSLFARIDTDNIHSQKVAERNGFVEISRNDEQIKYEYKPMVNIHEVTLTTFTNKPVTSDMIKRYGKKYDMFNYILPDDGKRYNKRNNTKHVASIAWFDNNTPVAVVSVLYDGKWKKDHQDGTNRIQGLEVNSEYRNKGIGQQVLNYALEELHANDAPTSLRVAQDNDIAISLYTKNNFKTIPDKAKDGYDYMLLECNLNSLSAYDEVTLITERLAELHKANPNLANILPDDGKELNAPNKYYCTKCWVNNEGTVVATASVRYPIANGNTYSDIQSITIAPGYENLSESVNEYVVTKLCNNRLFGESIVIPTESINIYDRKYEILEEAAKASNNKEIYPVYIFLVNSGSVMAKMINGVTGDDYTHAAISFTPDLKTMYSFGQKQENGTGFGFAVESINNKWYKGTDMLYSIYCVFVTGPQLKKMKDRVQYFVKHGTHFMFDFPGLFLNAMNISANPQHRYFCSRFVADVLNAGSPTKKNQYIKDASYMRPQDFTETNFAYFICSGKIKSFRPATVKKQTEKAKEEEINARIMRGKTSQHFTVQRFQEAASELHPMTREEMDSLNRKWDLRPIGKDYEKEKVLAEYDEKRKLKKEYKEKQREYKRQERERAKADRKKAKEDRAKAKAEAKKNSTKNEEVDVEHNYLFGDQIRWFDHQDYHNTVIGESIIKLEDQNMRFLDGLNEAASKKDKIVPVYVILTYTGSLVSRGVKFFTGDEYTHVSISFDSSLRNMYTFGRLNDENIFRGTFKREDISSPYYQNHDPKVPYAVYIVPCTESEMKLMKKRMKYFSENRDKFHFDFTGLFLNGLGIPNAPENRYFCSRFVSEVLNAGNPDSPLVADPTLQHPQDFVDADFTYLVVSGPDITEYDRRVADRIVKDILRSKELVNAQKNKVKNESFNSLSLNSDDPYQTDLLHYKLSMINEAHQLDDFIDYLRAFKINYDVSGNVIITRKEIDQLTEQYKFCTYRLNKHFYAANEVYWDDVKQELAVLTYLINLLNKYYLSPKVMQSNRVKKDLTDELLDLRSDMMKTYQDTLDKVLIHDPQFNANEYYKSSNLGNADKDAKTLETHLGKTVYIEL